MGLAGAPSVAPEKGCLNIFRGWSIPPTPTSAVGSQELKLEVKGSPQVMTAQPLGAVGAVFSAWLSLNGLERLRYPYPQNLTASVFSCQIK